MKDFVKLFFSIRLYFLYFWAQHLVKKHQKVLENLEKKMKKNHITNEWLANYHYQNEMKIIRSGL